MNDRNDAHFGWFFGTLFVLALLYMAALSAALEGWDLAFKVSAYAGMTIMAAAAIASLVGLVKDLRP